jgi:hypothetical protein
LQNVYGFPLFLVREKHSFKEISSKTGLSIEHIKKSLTISIKGKELTKRHSN